MEFYLEKTLNQDSGNVAHILKYLYHNILRYDGNYWYYFQQKWTIKEDEQNPLNSLITNELVNHYLSLANDYNKQIMEYTKLTSSSQIYHKDQYIPLIINDMIYKSKCCSTICLELNNHTYRHKVISSAKDLFLDKHFSYQLDLKPNLLGFDNGVYDLDNKRFDQYKADDMVFYSVNYNYQISNHNIIEGTPLDKLNKLTNVEIIKILKKLDLLHLLIHLSQFLSGRNNEPLIWISNLNNFTYNFLTGLLQSLLGDYYGYLPFSYLRKRKINPYQNELFNVSKKRIVVIEQKQEDYEGVNQVMIDTLVQEKSHIYKKQQYTNELEFKTQFGLIVLSKKSDGVPPEDNCIVIKANNLTKDTEIKEEWKNALMEILIDIHNKK